MLTLTPETILWIKGTANKLHGSEKRMYMAETVNLLGERGASGAQQGLGWDRNTIRKGQGELKSGAVEDKFSLRGRKKSEEYLSSLLEDIKKIAEPETQTDPTFNTTTRYTRLTAKEVRKQLVEMGYTDEALPTERCISNKINELGYTLKKYKR
jgi:hypothetical protein